MNSKIKRLNGVVSIWSLEGFSLKLVLGGLLGVVGFILPALCYSQSDLWCHVNPSNPLPGNVGRAVEISRENIFPVNLSSQMRAQKMLEKASVVEIPFESASSFVSELQPSLDKVHYYLVRASAVYDESRDLSTLVFAAAVFSDTRTLNVYSFALRSPEVKLKNLALVIRSTIQVESGKAVCETAA